VRRTLHGPDRNRPKKELAAFSSLLVTVAFFLIGLWSGQAVFFFMALSVVVIGIAEVLSHQRAANTMIWVGRGGMLLAIFYILVFLLPDG
jgi:uncharacterized membrane protein YiaA